jgi:hypothetical protein
MLVRRLLAATPKPWRLIAAAVVRMGVTDSLVGGTQVTPAGLARLTILSQLYTLV